jgi:cupin fold WbuC family metalloprotein
MSQPIDRNAAEPHALVPIGDAEMDRVSEAARESSRHRMILRYHEHEEPVQRMLNAIEPESYSRPHRHTGPHKNEVMLALRGSFLLVRFADDGTPLEGHVISEGGPLRGVEIPRGAWHTLLSLHTGSVVYELNAGPYDSATHKEFAPWAPPEDDREAGASYLLGLRAHFAPLIPELAARDRIEAEEDDIC